MFIKHGWPQTSLGLGHLRLAPGQDLDRVWPLFDQEPGIRFLPSSCEDRSGVIQLATQEEVMNTLPYTQHPLQESKLHTCLRAKPNSSSYIWGN